MSYFGVEEIEHLSARGAEDLDDTDPIRVLVHKLATSGKDGERTRSIIPAGIGSRVMFVPDGVGKRGPDAVELWGYLHGLLSQDCRALILAEDMCEDMRLTMDALSDWRNILPMVKHVYFNMYLREPQYLLADYYGAKCDTELDKRIQGQKMIENQELQVRMFSKRTSVLWEMLRATLRENPSQSAQFQMRDDGSHVVNVRWRHGEWVLVQNELLDSLEKRAQVQFTDDYNPKDDVKDECARGGAGANENRVTLNEKNICEEEWNEG